MKKYLAKSIFFLIFFHVIIFSIENNTDGLYGYHFKNGFINHPQTSLINEENNLSLNLNLLSDSLWEGRLAGLFLISTNNFFSSIASQKNAIQKIAIQFQGSFVQYSNSDFFDEIKQQIQNITQQNSILLNNFSFQINSFHFGFNFNFLQQFITEKNSRLFFDIDFGTTYFFQKINTFFVKDIFFANTIKNIFDPLEALQYNLGFFCNFEKSKINNLDVLLSCYLGLEIENYLIIIMAWHTKIKVDSYQLIFNFSFKNFNLEQDRFSSGFGIEIEKNIFLIGIKEFIPDFYQYELGYRRKI